MALAEKIGIPKAAREPGLHDSQLYGWRSKAQAKQDQSDLEQSLTAENADLLGTPSGVGRGCPSSQCGYRGKLPIVLLARAQS
ncbi:transposase [Candidatus Spongiihabitans sp.]|uniref:transposase n=1 Tax=Candidatus Spongiihabitans sp. TaxID=3101308 RepID=UPI003C7B23D6